MRFLVCLTLMALTGCQSDSPELTPVRVEIQRPLMGTLFRVVTYSTDQPTARRLMEEAFAKAEEIETIATDYDPNSELNRLCQSAPNTPVPVSETLFNLLQLAQKTATLTQGSYDPTLGPLTRLWRDAKRTRQLPDRDDLEQARQRCGAHHLVLDETQQTVTLTRAGMQLDLGGIAKGYAADVMFHHLAEADHSQTLVEAGGDLRLGEAPPEKEGWEVGLRTFHLTPTRSITLANCAVSTSGDLHQSIEIDGAHYSHIIDPRTGLGLTERKAATVIAPLAVTTDPLATAACVHPDPDQLIKQFPEASFRILSEKKNARPVKSGRFQEK